MEWNWRGATTTATAFVLFFFSLSVHALRTGFFPFFSFVFYILNKKTRHGSCSLCERLSRSHLVRDFFCPATKTIRRVIFYSSSFVGVGKREKKIF